MILLAPAIEELRALAVESQATLEPNGPETALGDTVDAFVSRANSPGGLGDDTAWLWTTSPHMEHNLSRVVMAGIAADARTENRRRRRTHFAQGAARPRSSTPS